MWFILKFLLILLLTATEVKSSLVEDVTKSQNKKTELWVGFAIGSASEGIGTGSVKVFVAVGTSASHAHLKALNLCIENAFNCFDIPELTTKQICRAVVGVVQYKLFNFLHGNNAQHLEDQCIAKFGEGNCSKAVSGC